MITATQLQGLYNKLYKEIRKYIWDFETVNALADLEVETYKSFPDMDELVKRFEAFKRCVMTTDILQEDKDTKKALDAFEEAINSEDCTMYANLTTFQEVPLS